MMGVTKAIQTAQEEFKAKLLELYKISIKKQRKWMQSNQNLRIGDLVYNLDLPTKLGYSRLARVRNINQDTAGTYRYFELEYKLERRFSTVQRPTQNLFIIMTKEEQEKGNLVDSLPFWKTVIWNPLWRNKKLWFRVQKMLTILLIYSDFILLVLLCLLLRGTCKNLKSSVA